MSDKLINEIRNGGNYPGVDQLVEAAELARADSDQIVYVEGEQVHKYRRRQDDTLQPTPHALGPLLSIVFKDGSFAQVALTFAAYEQLLSIIELADLGFDDTPAFRWGRVTHWVRSKLFEREQTVYLTRGGEGFKPRLNKEFFNHFDRDIRRWGMNGSHFERSERNIDVQAENVLIKRLWLLAMLGSSKAVLALFNRSINVKALTLYLSRREGEDRGYTIL